MNLLEETRRRMDRLKLTPSDISWIGSPVSGHFTWDEFVKLADVEYDKSFGSAKVASDLVIVFKNGDWFERHEYDGAESWEYKSIPRKPENKISPVCIVDNNEMWPSLADLNKPAESSK